MRVFSLGGSSVIMGETPEGVNRYCAEQGMFETVPNISEGRRPEVIRQLTDAVKEVSGASLLNCSSDPSHNRSVLTIVGEADALTRCLLHLFTVATARIDLRTHRGEHPRVGAVDVVPFVPLNDTPMIACVALARSVGQKVAARFGVPVYLYEDASATAARQQLEDIRRGQFEGLATKMCDEKWQPDFGPPTPHPSAGASIIGARSILIAFNVNLATDDIEIGRRIASRIRLRNGGLPYVKAMGVALRHRSLVQVSMNLTNYHRTQLVQAFAFVKREADDAGVVVADTEVVGMVPADALTDTDIPELRLKSFTPDQILPMQR